MGKPGNPNWKPGQKAPGSKQFEKGKSGNPAGRPKLPDLKEIMDKVLGEEKDGITALELIMKQVRAKAAKGDIRATELLLDRGFGKPKQSLDVGINENISQIKIEIQAPVTGSNGENTEH